MADEGAPAPPRQEGTQEGELARLRAELHEVKDEKEEVKESIREDKIQIAAGKLSEEKEKLLLLEAIAAREKRLATLEDRVSKIEDKIDRLTNPAGADELAGNSNILRGILATQQELIGMFEENMASSHKSGPSFSKFSGLLDTNKCAVASQLLMEDYPVPTHSAEDPIWKKVRRSRFSMRLPTFLSPKRGGHHDAVDEGVHLTPEVLKSHTLAYRREVPVYRVLKILQAQSVTEVDDE
eukprot:m.55689 g.55689  ORF g.55689 m.55689 type:complete len:239 (+) comp7620_c0_seq2:1216-1932(+)